MDLLSVSLIVAFLAPLLASVVLGLATILLERRPGEAVAYRLTAAGLAVSALADVAAICAVYEVFGPAARASLHGVEVDFGSWLTVGTYTIPVVALVDRVSMAFALLAAFLTSLVAAFSRTYLHREPGFLRFFVLLSLFASGTQLVAWAGALDVMFAGWELMGWSSALYIGFFCERREPVRSSLRAFTTYRLCDVGFLLAMVTTHEFVGSTRLAALQQETIVAPAATPLIAAMFVLAALGKSAQLPFSGWLPRAMEGPTPSSALFYGGLSIHVGLYLVLRVWPVVAASPVVRGATVAIGLATALYATAVARVHPDAKGALAHATLAQVGLILAEIALGFTTLALFHILGHASLRVWQYLRAPNTIHDAHRLGHHAAPPFLAAAPAGLAARSYLAALHRLRLDERIDALLSPVLLLARGLDRLDAAYWWTATLDAPVAEDRR